MYSNDIFNNSNTIAIKTVNNSIDIITISSNPRVNNSKYVDIKKYIYSTSNFVQELDNSSYNDVINNTNSNIECSIIIYYAPWYHYYYHHYYYYYHY